MKNTYFDFAQIYGLIRLYYLHGLPEYRPVTPDEVMNLHLRAAGSTLKLVAPGEEQGYSSNNSSELERFLITRENREALYDDIREFTFWMSNYDYLAVDWHACDEKGAARATDKLVRTPALAF